MGSIRVCFMRIPNLLKQNSFISRLGSHSCGIIHQNHNILYGSSVLTTQTRNLFNIKDSSKDEIPEGRRRVYYGLLTPQIRTVKWFSMTTSILGIISQPFLYKELSALNNMPMLIAGCSFVGLFTFVTPVFLHFVTKKYITHLDYVEKEDKYVASTVNFFCMLKETEFKIADVKVPDIPGMFTTFLAKGKPLFFEARLFEDPHHYAKIMGYDKPMDFKLYKTSESNKSSANKIK